MTKLSAAVVLVTFMLSSALLAPTCNAQQIKSQQPKQGQLPGIILNHNHVGVDPVKAQQGYNSNDATGRGEALFARGDFEGATVAFQEAIKFQPCQASPYLHLAEVYAAKGRLAEAISTYRTLFYDWPGKGWGDSAETDTRNLMKFALVLLKAGQRAEALRVYQQGIHYLPTDRGPLPPLFTSPDFPAADFQAAAYTATGIYTTDWSDPNGGEGDFERAIATQPNLAVPYFYRGLILKFRPGRAADALAAFDRAERLGGPAIQPFVDKAMKDGTMEFREAVRRAGLVTQP